MALSTLVAACSSPCSKAISRSTWSRARWATRLPIKPSDSERWSCSMSTSDGCAAAAIAAMSCGPCAAGGGGIWCPCRGQSAAPALGRARGEPGPARSGGVTRARRPCSPAPSSPSSPTPQTASRSTQFGAQRTIDPSSGATLGPQGPSPINMGHKSRNSNPLLAKELRVDPAVDSRWVYIMAGTGRAAGSFWPTGPAWRNFDWV